jgi:hypothetical protein
VFSEPFQKTFNKYVKNPIESKIIIVKDFAENAPKKFSIINNVIFCGKVFFVLL